MTNETKLIKVEDVQAGRLSETILQQYDPIGDLEHKLMETMVSKNLSRQQIKEAFVMTPDAFSLLRDGIRFLSFMAYANTPRSFTSFAAVTPSNRPQEEYLRDAAMGTLPQVPSGTPAPMLISNFEGGALIKNFRYAGMVKVTGDDLRFDRVGKMRQIAPELGRSARMTEEAAVYAAISTTANFVRNSTTGDNDVGANIQTLTFSGIGLETALSIISTSKDNKSGAYLGLMADTLIVTPRLEFAAKQLLLADALVRASANNTAEVRGTGQTPIYRGKVTNIIVSPWFGNSFQWALCDSTRTGLVFQEVEGFNVVQETMGPASESWLVRDEIRWLVQGYFGIGMVDDRPWFYSDSTTAATVS